jgi:hypothetical protein
MLTVLRSLAVAAALAAAAPTHAATQEEQAYQAGLAAYVYGYPPLISQGTADKLPPNTMISIAALQDPSNRLIVLPNVDTPYTVGNLNLADQPLVLHVPAIPRSRYYVFELLDAYTNVIGYVGTRTTGTQAGDYALAGPDWNGTLPAGVKLIRSDTNRIVMVGRTLALGPDDIPNVRKIQEQYGLTPLSDVAAGAPPKQGVILDQANGLTHPDLPTGLPFLDALGALLQQQPPPGRDAKVLAQLAKFGVGPGMTPSTEDLPDAVKQGLARGVAAGPARVVQLLGQFRTASQGKNHGWVLLTKGIGAYGTNYDLRATTALEGLWANTAQEAFYPIADQDSTGRRLNGRRRRYVLHFTKSQLPPARAFWSLTMYDKSLFLYANPIDRYAIGDRTTGLKRDAHGGVTIYIQHARPAGAKAANWLPAPAARFTLALRLYWPTAGALRGEWKPPGVERVG